MSDLYAYADKNNIEIDYFPLRDTKSLSIIGAIALNPNIVNTSSDMAVCLAHELGHHATNSFYKINSKFETRNRMEERATRWAVEQLVPIRKLKNELKNGLTEIWQLAEFFNVTPEFMNDVIRVYKAKGRL